MNFGGFQRYFFLITMDGDIGNIFIFIICYLQQVGNCIYLSRFVLLKVVSFNVVQIYTTFS